MTYKFKAFPKWLNTPDGKRHLVKTAVDEMNLLAPFKTETPVQVAKQLVDAASIIIAPVEAPDILAELECDKPIPATKEQLVVRAEELSLIYDKRWGVERLAEVVSAAEASLQE